MNSITIGRSAQCDIVLEHESVSRFHAHIEQSGEQSGDERPLVIDEDSHNGTWLCRNGRWIRVLKTRLGKQDRVRFGELELDRNMILGRLRHAAGNPDDTAHPRETLVRPRRNPETGDIEEDRG